jgi:hypothetical protein
VRVANGAGSLTSTNAALMLRDSPYVSAVQATPGERAALISWNTSVDSDSLVQYQIAGVGLATPSAAAADGAAFDSSFGRDPALTANHVVLITGLTPDSLYSFQVISTAGSNNYVSGVYQFSTAGNLVLDNSNAVLTGSWTVGNSSIDKYGDNYVYATSSAGEATATATFQPNITTPGKYEVYAWYPQGGNRANNTPYSIVYNGGTLTVTVNQQLGGGSWQLLASGLDFAKGTNGYVRVSNNAGPSVVLADAVRFSYQDSQELPANQTIPAWWQNFYFGGPVNPLDDPDGDGYSTAQEYVMGTSPTNAASHLIFTGNNASNSVKVDFWPFLGNRSYQLLFRPDVGLPPWQVADGQPAAGANGHGNFSVSITNAPRNFYRLQVELTSGSAIPAKLAAPSTKSLSPYASDPICGPNRAYVR